MRDPGSPTESQATSGLFSRSNTIRCVHSELPQEGFPTVITHASETYPHLNQKYEELPPSRLSKKKQKGIKRYVSLRFPGSFKRPSVPLSQPIKTVGTEGLTSVSRVEGDPTVHGEL